MTESTDVANLVKELRLNLQLTQEEFAARLGVTFCTINRWENRRSQPSRMARKLIEELRLQLASTEQHEPSR